MSDLIKDPLDFASQLAEEERNNNVKEIQRKIVAMQFKVAGVWPVLDCEDCGEEIGLARIEATSAVTCISCATRKEQRGKFYAK